MCIATSSQCMQVSYIYIAIIISAGFTATTYNVNIDRQLATIYENFSYEFLPENLAFYEILALQKFGAIR